MSNGIAGAVPGFGTQEPAAFPAAPSGASATPALAAGSVAELVWVSDGEPTFPLQKPNAVTTDPQGNLWVTDGGHDRFVIFSPDGAAIEAWGAPGSGDGGFEFGCSGITYGGVVFDVDGAYYVADSGNRRIQKFAPDRTFLMGWSRQGIVDNQLLVTARGNRTSGESLDSCPVALGVDQQGRVIVSDRVAAEIQVFAADGRPLGTATEKGMRPEGVTVDGAGNIWVADNGNRVLKFSPEGTLLTTWGRSGHDDGEFTTPMSIAVDVQGRVFVGDQSGRVQIFTPDGAFLGALASRGIDSRPFSEPVGLFLDGLGHLYVVEHYGNRIYKFSLLAPFGP